MAYGFSWDFATSYTQLRDLIASKIEAAGWVEQGSTSIYKSPAADEQGNFAYVLVTDDGVGKPRLECSSRLNAAGTALLLPIGQSSEVNNWPKMWHFYIYNKWFYCFEIDLSTNSTDAYLGAGLFRPLPTSLFWHSPIWVYAGNGSDSGDWISATTGTNNAGRVRYPGGEIWYAAPGLTLAAQTSPMLFQAQFGGGLFVQPCILWTAKDVFAIIGSLYNTVILGGIGWESTEVLIPANTKITYGNDRIFMVPFRIRCHQAVSVAGMSPAFQIDGFE